jgi:hypothetical protein
MGNIGTDPYPGTQCTVTSLVYKTQDPYLEQGEGSRECVTAKKGSFLFTSSFFSRPYYRRLIFDDAPKEAINLDCDCCWTLRSLWTSGAALLAFWS